MILLTGGYIFAGDMFVNIDRPFEAAGKTHPPGRYRFIADNDTDFIELMNINAKTTDKIKYSSRLSSRASSGQTWQPG